MCLEYTGVNFMQVKLTKIFFFETLFRFWFIQDFGLFRVWFRQVYSGFWFRQVYTGFWFIQGLV